MGDGPVSSRELHVQQLRHLALELRGQRRHREHQLCDDDDRARSSRARPARMAHETDQMDSASGGALLETYSRFMRVPR